MLTTDWRPRNSLVLSGAIRHSRLQKIEAQQQLMICPKFYEVGGRRPFLPRAFSPKVHDLLRQ